MWIYELEGSEECIPDSSHGTWIGGRCVLFLFVSHPFKGVNIFLCRKISRNKHFSNFHNVHRPSRLTRLTDAHDAHTCHYPLMGGLPVSTDEQRPTNG